METYPKKIFIISIICCVIGVPIFFSGCGTNIPNTCFSYIVTKGQVYNYLINSEICKRCTNKNSDNKCTNYNYYTCYNGIIKISYEFDSHNKTCNNQIYTHKENYLQVEQDLKWYYPIGYKSKLFVNKINHNSCSFNKIGLQALTYIGLTFCSVSLMLLIISIILGVVYKIIDIKKISLIIPINYNNSDIQIVNTQNYTEYSEQVSEELKNPV